ncbi:hypothetical protein R0K05_24830, partial [Planococcus sp. SIMBA_160]
DLEEINEEYEIENLTKKQIKSFIKEGYYKVFLEEYNLDESYLKIERSHKKSDVLIEPKVIDITITAHFLPADIFRIGGE